ncbi:glycosyltransferase family 2 protein [Vibrio ezurae]|uniref:Putative glycosyltransferase n=1 Tax=Vibrio ezurae NBRC 102218 TaxID=1219080 RepID=U3CK41_9VIBR|nr:glycosyltransferase family 2 protein [Vibrio ezurae]GAD78588.1 putative glycosyltransferase [Vibrio ezurae NBRC 102218]
MNNLDIAVLLPCHNEAGAIGDTIEAFKNALPTATIYVYDNNSTDTTVEEAKTAGAIVRFEPRQGKGEVVRRMFADIEADIYIMADGDNTYDATIAPELVETLIQEQLDMIVGTRSKKKDSYPIGHILGNTFFSKLINNAFSSNLTDVFSGYRVMTRRFVKSVPVFSDGFQVETELTVHSLQHKLPIKEVPTKYISRPEGTKSKLSTFSDGFKILNFIFFLLRNVRPMLFFFALSSLFMLASLGLGIPVVYEFIETGLVKRFPTAILASSLGVISVLLSFTGLILDNVRQSRLEINRLHYLALTKNI